MSKLPLGPWVPDQVANDAPVAQVAVNVYPQADGYGPVPSPVPFGGALPGVCLGAFDAQRSDGTWVHYAGTQTKLFRFNSASLAWEDVSGTSSYLVPPGDYWSFALYGSRLFAVHLGAVPQFIDIDTGTQFADLRAADPANQPPRARFAAVVSEFLMLGNLLGNPAAVQWSGIGDPSYWTPGINDSDIQILPDGGNVTGLVSVGQTLIAFQDRAIQHFVFSPGTAAVFSRTKLEDARGAVAPWSIVELSGTIYFLDRDGFYAFTGGASQPIGKEKVNRWWQSLRDPVYPQTALAVIDPTGPRIMWAFKSINTVDATLLDEAICYDYVQNRWTQISFPQPFRYWFRAQTTPVSLDSITESLTGSTPYNFAAGLSLDSPIFSGGIPIVGVIGTDNRLALLSGPNLEATVETSDAQLARPARAYVRGLRVDTDADNWFAAIGTRESLGGSVQVRWRQETGPNAERFAYTHASGRYHRARIRIQAGDSWNYVASIEPDATAEGMR